MIALMTAKQCFRGSKVKEKQNLTTSDCLARSEKVHLEKYKNLVNLMLGISSLALIVWQILCNEEHQKRYRN